jgi:hypothetical protein
MLKIIEFIKKYYPFIFFVAIIFLTLFLFQTCSTLERERANWEAQQAQNEQNVHAITDSIVVEFNKKLKAWEFSKDNYVVQKLSDLEQYNKDLANQLKKVKGDVLAAIKTQVEADLGNVTASNKLTMLDANYYGLRFNTKYNDLGLDQELSGMSKFYVYPDNENRTWYIKPDSTVIDTNKVSIRVTYGFKEFDNKYQVFALSQSPKVALTDLTGGYFIDKQIVPLKKPKKWGVGPYAGFGLNTAANGNDPRFGWSIGFAVTYDILQW